MQRFRVYEHKVEKNGSHHHSCQNCRKNSMDKENWDSLTDSQIWYELNGTHFICPECMNEALNSLKIFRRN